MADFVEIKGKVKFANLTIANEWHKHNITLYPDREGLDTLRDLQAVGVKNQLKKDDDGYYTSFNRPTFKETKDSSGNVLKRIDFDPPEVIDKDGNPFKDFLGKGTDVTVVLEVYSHPTPTGGRAKAARLLKCRVDSLVPYVKPASEFKKPSF